MKTTYKAQEKFVNAVTVRGALIGLFISEEHWSDIGSKRAIVESVFGRYESDIDIDIISKNITTIPTVTNS